jgi:cytochrome c biogenesis protein
MNSQIRPLTKVDSVMGRRITTRFDWTLRFLSSVKLGIGLMIVVAVATILGTVIVQAPLAEPGQIDQLYAPQTRQIFEFLGLLDVFHAGWYVTLLALLCLNITFASIDRFPATWQYLRKPKTIVDESFIETLPFHSLYLSKKESVHVEGQVFRAFRCLGLKVTPVTKSGLSSIFGEKGKCSRLAVYVVHASLLLIFAGAIIDSLFGFHASLTLLEGETSDKVILQTGQATVSLPFQIRCDGAGVEHYSDGTPRKWWSDLVILQQGREVSRKRILVNDPMDYGGIRIFQSSFGASGVPAVNFTGLQIAKQPGQNIIWLGSFLMITGLIYSFYFSHQRIWAILRINENGHTVLKLGGTSNKNQVAFGKAFQAMVKTLDGD